MKPTQPGQLNLAGVIEQESVVIHFQPLVAARTRTVTGVEALARGVDPVSGRMISPGELFAAADSDELLIHLDRLCRYKAMQAFAQAQNADSPMILSLNFEASLLDKGVLGSGHMVNLARQIGLDPSHIVIEIVETRVSDTQALQHFVAAHKSYGFLLALDDVGSGHSSLERIALLQPDIIKVDRSLVSGLDHHYHKREVTNSLIKLGHKIGALVVAEGVETQTEALLVLEMGADILQGFHFSRPQPSLIPDARCRQMIRETTQAFKEYMVRKIAAQKAKHGIFKAVTDDIARHLEGAPRDRYDEMLDRLIAAYPELECLYILDEEGTQISQTVCDQAKLNCHRRAVFWPAAKHSDQSLKRYYLLLAAGLERFVSEPYISQASGNFCVTISFWFGDHKGRRLILCADFVAEPTAEKTLARSAAP
jgi:EAL domain-containing protein (putative c-di-GMP-specific phosphodiesterase class I)